MEGVKCEFRKRFGDAGVNCNLVRTPRMRLQFNQCEGRGWLAKAQGAGAAFETQRWATGWDVVGGSGAEDASSDVGRMLAKRGVPTWGALTGVDDGPLPRAEGCAPVCFPGRG